MGSVRRTTQAIKTWSCLHAVNPCGAAKRPRGLNRTLADQRSLHEVGLLVGYQFAFRTDRLSVGDTDSCADEASGGEFCEGGSRLMGIWQGKVCGMRTLTWGDTSELSRSCQASARPIGIRACW